MAATVIRRTLDLAGLDVPVVEVTGALDGPTLTVIAGVHGCEYAPMAAVRRWTAELKPDRLRGRVRAVPVLNLPAFEARSPFVVPQDGKNLNRCFPGDSAGTLAERLAHATFTQLIEGSDAVVDAHAGDLPEALEPFAFYDAGPAEARARELAVGYGFRYVIRQQPGPGQTVAGSTSAAAAAIGVPAVIAEAGGYGLLDDAAVELHVRGLYRVLDLLGMARGGAYWEDDRLPVYLDRFIWVRCGQAGWWQPRARVGDQVTEGELIGSVTSIDGATVLEEVHAPADGVLLFLTSSPAVGDDGLLLGLGAR
ncbi:MAG TPA: succinylglutamate desuccinylase/aspartoacylase family protein [Streptosporangiaceae bacterium]